MTSKTVETIIEINLDEFDDDELMEEMELRGFHVEKESNVFTCYPLGWDELGYLVATGQTREALDLMAYISGGRVNAICALNAARSLNQARIKPYKMKTCLT